MKGVELYGQVRRAVFVEGMSRRAAVRRFGIEPRTVAKMLAFSVPPGYRRSRPPARPKLDPFVGIIDRILEEDKGQPAKQQHTSKRIFDRLRDEHGYTGGITIARGYVHERRQRQREMFVPLRHEPGHAQVDFGEALAAIGGVARKIHFFAMDLPHSDACLVQAYPAESSEAFCEGHNVSFAKLNARLLECCRRRLNDRLRGHDETIGERLVRDRAVLLPLLASPYEAREKKAARVSSLSLVRYRGNDYSGPTAYGHREVLVRGYVLTPRSCLRQAFFPGTLLR
jgi:hypothetical protein